MLALYTLSDFAGIGSLNSLIDLNSLNNLSGLNSLILSITYCELDIFINPGTKMTYPGLSMWDGSSKIYYFIEFWPSFRTEAVEDRNVTLNQIQRSKVKCQLPMNIQIPLIWQILSSKTL
jgi:hypothetical protein